MQSEAENMDKEKADCGQLENQIDSTDIKNSDQPAEKKMKMNQRQ